MTRPALALSAVLLGGVALGGCASTPDAQGAPTLREAYADAFLVGVALNARQVTEPGATPLVPQFNAATPENVMKWEVIHPAPGVYDWGGADAFVDYAEAHGLSVTGHTLVWHSQTPAWVFEDEGGAALSREALLARMEEHISAVVGRYRGRVDGWDVVNEALDGSGDGSLRDSPWRRIIGDDYVAHAFRFAHAADPDARLYYNDYALVNPEKRAGAIRLVRGLLDAGVPITGIGIQGHMTMDWPAPARLDSTIRELAVLGDVVVSELDIDVLPDPGNAQSADVSRSEDGTPALDPYRDGLPADAQQRLADRYAEVFRVLHRHRGAISRVTFWGLTDGDSWRNDWPVRGRTNHPLLFDRAGRPKPAFEAVIGVAE